ncbi:hypothetical protein SLS62_005546 [Diatrype stigma]|uniref:Uncharacterized protein n=1 Tax=Diatrype stigma TaxID=117547 RepID=A0AAN9URJ0_9PEZI
MAVFAAAANVRTLPATSTSLSPTHATNTQSPGALTTSGPPIIVLDTPPESANRTTFTTTYDGGDVITGVFELKTLANYTDLHQHLTVTSTTTYNGTDGTVETAVAAGIVMAGGATWVLLNYAEAAGVFDGVLEEVAVDDPGCPTTPPACARSDCKGGELGFCEAPAPWFGRSLFGCVCEDTCQDAEMFCYECNGRDGKCQSGDYEGCDCTTEKCPSGPDTLNCDDCGSDGREYGICDGLWHKGYRYKDCECNAVTESDPYPGRSESVMAALEDQQKHLSKWDGNWALSSPVECQKSSDFVPQRRSDNVQNVEDRVNFFCARYNGHLLRSSSAIDEPYTLNTVSEEVGFWIRAEYRGGLALDTVVRGQCPKEVMLDGHECARLLTEAMSQCDPLVGDSHGHLVKGQCADYSVVVDRDEAADGRSPPWHRLPEDQRWGSCDGNEQRAITNRYFQHMYPVYCGGTQDTLRYTDFANTISVPESTEAPRPRADDGRGYKFRFAFERKKGGDGTGPCYKTCTQAFNALSKGSCKFRL